MKPGIPILPLKHNDVRKGEAAEAFVVAKLLKWGFSASHVQRDLPYDVTVDMNGRICRVQVKGRSNPTGERWEYRSCRGNWRSKTGTYDYVEGDYDIAAFVALSLEKVLFVPGVRKAFRAKTADFIHHGAELESWKRAVAELERKPARLAWVA